MPDLPPKAVEDAARAIMDAEGWWDFNAETVAMMWVTAQRDARAALTAALPALRAEGEQKQGEPDALHHQSLTAADQWRECPEHGPLCVGDSCCCADKHAPAAPTVTNDESPVGSGRSPVGEAVWWSR